MATRVIVEVEDDQVRPISVRHVDMLIPEQAGDAAASHLYGEVRGEDERPLLSLSISAHLRPLEVFSPDGSIKVVEPATRKQTVMLMVPDVEGGRSLVFMRRRSLNREGKYQRKPQSDSAGPEELTRVDLEIGGEE